MMNLMAGMFAGIGLMFGGMFGGHHAVVDANASTTAQENHMGSTSPWRNGEGSTTPWGGRQGMMGSTTPGHTNAKMPGVLGKVTAVSGTTFTVVGHAGVNSATTTYTVDASSAKVLKPGIKSMASSTPLSVSNIKIGDTVVVVGTVSGTSITATTIVEGMPNRPAMMRPGTQK